MKTINILGYSENILPLLTESIKVKFPHIELKINIVQNLKLSISKNAEKIIFENSIIVFDIENFKFANSDFNILGVFNPKIKETIFNIFKESHNISREQYFNLLHSSSIIASSCELNSGIYIEPLTIISPLASIQFGVSINRNCSIGHHTSIGEFSTIAPGVNIGGNCKIGSYSTIGIGATIFNKIKIGNNSIIGGGSIVTKDIPDNVVAYGNPCKIQRKL